jgi:hypothetical protein
MGSKTAPGPTLLTALNQEVIATWASESSLPPKLASLTPLLQVEMHMYMGLLAIGAPALRGGACARIQCVMGQQTDRGAAIGLLQGMQMPRSIHDAQPC